MKLHCVALALVLPACITTESAVGLERADARNPVDAAIDVADAAECSIAESEGIDALLKISVDNSYTLWVNGAQLSFGPLAWWEARIYPLRLHRHPARANVIAIEALNQGQMDGVDRGVLFELKYKLDGVEHTIVSDAACRVAGERLPSWNDVAFDDSMWADARILIDHGTWPYDGSFAERWGPSEAKWIWTYNAGVPSSMKPKDETIFVRRTIYFGVDGTPRATASSCP